MRTVQFMAELGECQELSLSHLSFGLFHESTLFGGKDVVGVDHTFGFDQNAVLLLGERHKVPFPDVQGVEDVSRDDQLTALADAADPLLSCGWFQSHTSLEYLIKGADTTPCGAPGSDRWTRPPPLA